MLIDQLSSQNMLIKNHLKQRKEMFLDLNRVLYLINQYLIIARSQAINVLFLEIFNFSAHYWFYHIFFLFELSFSCLNFEMCMSEIHIWKNKCQTSNSMMEKKITGCLSKDWISKMLQKYLVNLGIIYSGFRFCKFLKNQRVESKVYIIRILSC